MSAASISVLRAWRMQAEGGLGAGLQTQIDTCSRTAMMRPDQAEMFLPFFQELDAVAQALMPKPDEELNRITLMNLLLVLDGRPLCLLDSHHKGLQDLALNTLQRRATLMARMEEDHRLCDDKLVMLDLRILISAGDEAAMALARNRSEKFPDDVRARLFGLIRDEDPDNRWRWAFDALNSVNQDGAFGNSRPVLQADDGRLLLAALVFFSRQNPWPGDVVFERAFPFLMDDQVVFLARCSERIGGLDGYRQTLDRNALLEQVMDGGGRTHRRL